MRAHEKNHVSMAAACDTICGSDFNLARNHWIASERARKIKTGFRLADLNPRTHIVEEERIHFYKLSFDFHMCAAACTDAHMHKQMICVCVYEHIRN